MLNAANRKDIREAEKAAKLRSLQDAEAIVAIMSSIPGRAWMWRKLAEAHIFEPNLIPDVRLSAMWDGERNFGLRLLNDIMEHCPEQYLQMTREGKDNDRHNRDDRRTGTSSDPDSSSASERRSGSIPDGGDLGQDGGPTGYDTGDEADPIGGDEAHH